MSAKRKYRGVVQHLIPRFVSYASSTRLVVGCSSQACIKDQSEFIEHAPCGRGVGLVWDIPDSDTCLVITGDTGWTETLDNYHKRLRAPNVVLVAHISTVCREEVLGSLLEEQPGYYQKHLGIRGLCRVIESLQPAHVILSEIGEELGSVIEALAELVRSVYPCSCEVGWRRYQKSFPVSPVKWD